MAGPRNIVLCFDGTWNSDDRSSPTNVVKTHQALPDATAAGTPQIAYYDRGVGTGRFDRVRGGVVGLGLARNVEIAYVWLSSNYRPGDRLFLFGYSRGAYTARSLAGLIGLCGVPDPERCAAAGRPVDLVARQGMAVYRQRAGPARDDAAGRHVEEFALGAAGADSRPAAAAAASAHRGPAADAAAAADGGPDPAAAAADPRAADFAPTADAATDRGPTAAAADEPRAVHFIGVWDTVGALGVPVTWLNWIGARRHRFHDVRLDRHIRHACHAVAIDEQRRPFAPTLWLSPPAEGQQVEQLWFPGVHGDVGGGRPHAGLSDGALLWMWSKAFAAGLAFEPRAALRDLAPDPFGPQGKMSPVYRVWGRHDRPIGEADEDGRPAVTGEAVHFSAMRRLENPDSVAYRDGVAGRTLLPALEEKRVRPAPPAPGEEDRTSLDRANPP